MLGHILAGGFARGYRTYILGAILALQAVAQWAVGDASLVELINRLPEILGGLGLMTLRAGISNRASGIR